MITVSILMHISKEQSENFLNNVMFSFYHLRRQYVVPREGDLLFNI